VRSAAPTTRNSAPGSSPPCSAGWPSPRRSPGCGHSPTASGPGGGHFRNISVGGEHLHHYLWGIGLLSGIGAVAVRGEERHRRHPAVALGYGSGLALIVYEFALLLELKDVYWARQGRISVDIGVGGIAVAGSYFAALPVLRRLRRQQGRARY
jgi:hypothetical protein